MEEIKIHIAPFTPNEVVFALADYLRVLAESGVAEGDDIVEVYEDLEVWVYPAEDGGVVGHSYSGRSSGFSENYYLVDGKLRSSEEYTPNPEPW